jgi:hypothetical protein
MFCTNGSSRFSPSDPILPLVFVYRLFSICRFREVTGTYPEKITMVSFTFKQRRFETLHLPALQWPSDRFEALWVQILQHLQDLISRHHVQENRKNAAKPFEVQTPLWVSFRNIAIEAKGAKRNPFHRTAPYAF